MTKPGPTQQLPKATVQLAKNTGTMAKNPMATPPSAPVKQRAEKEEFYEEKDPEAGLSFISVLCLVGSLLLMAINLFGTDKAGFFAEKGVESPYMVPAPDDPTWEVKLPDGTHRTTFDTKLKEVTDKLK